MKEGKVVKAVPPAGRRSPIDWDSMASLAKLTGKPVLAAENVRNSQVNAVRQYNRPPFVTEEGRIVVELRNSKLVNGVRWGNVYLRWEPTTTTDTTTKESK